MSTARITFTGDILCAPGLTERCTHGGKRDYMPALDGIKGLLADTDLLVGNLETPVAGEELGFTNERYCFNSPDEFAQMLREFGFGLLCLANNHCMDRGEAGIDRTLDTLDRLGLPHTGLNRSGERRPCVIEVNGIRVAFVNYTYGTNAFAHHRFLSDDTSGRVNLFQPQETLPGSIHLLEPMEKIAAETERLYSNPNPEFDSYIKPHLDMLRDDIAAAKSVSDFTVAVMHSGGQYNPLPDAYTRMLASKLREYGADCIVGHHPHLIHPCETENGFLCAYSLGNLYCMPSITPDPTEASYSVLLGLTLTKENGRTQLTGGDFSLIRTLEDRNIPYCAEADQAYADRNEILHFAGKFAGRKFTSVNKTYRLF